MQKRSILITGIPGSGKSTVCRELTCRGYEACDIEDEKFGLFAMYRKDTGEIFKDFDNFDLEKRKNCEWLCDIRKLKDFLSQQKSEIGFYCGIGSNTEEFIPFFEQAFYLSCSPEMVNERLSHREGQDDAGGTDKGREEILGWKEWWEKRMEKIGVRSIDANDSSPHIVERILCEIGERKIKDRNKKMIKNNKKT